MAVVIVESPAKAKTINRYLGNKYNVKKTKAITLVNSIILPIACQFAATKACLSGNASYVNTKYNEIIKTVKISILLK